MNTTDRNKRYLVFVLGGTAILGIALLLDLRRSPSQDQRLETTDVVEPVQAKYDSSVTGDTGSRSPGTVTTMPFASGEMTNVRVAAEMQRFMEDFLAWSVQSSTQDFRAPWSTHDSRALGDSIPGAERINEQIMRRYQERWKRAHNPQGPIRTLPPAVLGE